MTQFSENLGFQELHFDDPLLGCLVILTKFDQQPHSMESLTAGLPLVGRKLTPQLFIRAAGRIGYYAKVVKRPIDRIPGLVLPAVLVLKDDRACLITEYFDDGTAEVIFPETDVSVKRIRLETIADQYSGYAIFCQKQVDFEKRADEFEVQKEKSWFWGTMFRYKSIFVRVMMSAFLINAFALATPIFIMIVYDKVIPNSTVETLWVLASGVGIIFLFDFVMKVLRGHFIDISGKKTDVLLASTLFNQMLSINLSSKPSSSGAFANNLREFEVLRDFFTSATLTCFIDFPFVLLFIYIIYMIGGVLAIVPLIAVPLVILAGILLEIPMRRAIEKAYIGSNQKHAVLIESINGLETLKSMVAEGTMLRRWEKYIGITYRASQRSRFFSVIAMSFATFIQQVVTVTVVILGVYLIMQGQLTVGGLIACTILAGRALAPLAQITNILIRIQQSRIALKGLNKIMELPHERPMGKKYTSYTKLKGSVEFENVTFAYPTSDYAVLNNVSFKIEAGDKMGIIGGTGSGKTTIQRLILGLYKPQDGNIKIDNIDIAQIDPVDLRRNIGSVLQDFTLFYGTLRDNIALRAPWVEDSAVIKVAEFAAVDQFANEHHEGYRMLIDERGASMSGGQRQCIALARAYLGNPPVFLFDEPTSAMDFKTEKRVITNLQKMIVDKTLILTAHRMSILNILDKLIVIDKGTVLAQGSKDKILERLGDNTAGEKDE